MRNTAAVLAIALLAGACEERVDRPQADLPVQEQTVIDTLPNDTIPPPVRPMEP